MGVSRRFGVVVAAACAIASVLALAPPSAAVEGDIDNDTILDGPDNCDATFNPLQGDHDLDLLGNACDPNFGEQDLVGGTIYENRLCQAITLAPNDDSSSPESEKVFFPQELNFFGAPQRFAYVNNNGNITFVEPLGEFTPFEIDALTPPIIGPFFADVDTRPVGGGKVTYGVALNAQAFGGRNVSCFTWEHVGYFSNHVEKRNTFQLLIVDRSDVAPGDFDIYFNYARLDWETGDASGGEDGLGGTSAAAGFSSGTGDPNGFFSMPCSLINGQCIDSNTSSGLRATSTNTTIRGRHIFPVRNGVATFPGSVSGDTQLHDPPLQSQPLVNALTELCREQEDGSFDECRSTFTVVDGTFEISNVRDGDWRLRVFPQRIGGANQNPRRLADGFEPSGLGIDPLPITVFLHVNPGQDVVLPLLTTTSGSPPPAGVTFGRNRHGGFFPHIVHGQPTTFTISSACPGDATYEILVDGVSVETGTLFDQADGTVEGTVTLVDLGLAEVRVTFPGCNTITFNAYIDPSGFVVDQHGTPIPGASVTLVRSDFPEGPFTVVPSGSETMSPSNRENPDVTDDTGFFGWDTLAGFYRVDATSPGCSAGATPVLPVPPEQVDLQIVLTCGGGGGGGGGGSGGTVDPPVSPPTTQPPGPTTAAEAFVTVLYREVLGRQPDATALPFWAGRLEAGASRHSVVTAVLHSSESVTRQIRAVYQLILHRAPDAGGLAFWRDAVAASARIESVMEGLLGSPEYLARAGGTTGGFVDALFEDLLGRAPDAAGRAFWIAALERGAARPALILTILQSQESAARVVAAAYRDILERDPDAVGGPFYTAIYMIDTNRMALAGLLLQSEEFLANL